MITCAEFCAVNNCQSVATTPCLKKTVQHCFCQNFIKFPPILIILGRKVTKRLKLCKMYSFSTSSNSRHHITVLNADVRNCYIMLKVVIFSKFSNDLNTTSKVKCGLFSRIISSYNSVVQNCQNLCSEWDRRTRTQALRRQRHRKRKTAFAASCFVSRHRICGFMGICHCTGLKELSAIFSVEYFIHKLIKSRGTFYRTDDANVSNLILIMTALCNNLEHLRLTR